MKYKKYLADRELGIHVFDDVFPLSFRTAAYTFFKNSLFKIGWSDSNVLERQSNDYFLHSSYDLDDLANLGIMKFFENTKEIKDLMDGWSPEKAILNLSTMSDANYLHSHEKERVFLYYGNIEWMDGAHGETHWYSEDLKEIIFSTPYVPGRLIVFDGGIPHCVRPQSIVGPKYRFTLATIFSKNS